MFDKDLIDHVNKELSKKYHARIMLLDIMSQVNAASNGCKLVWKQGSNHYKAKLTEKDVKAIRRSKKPTRELVKKYGITHSTIWAIRHRVIWRHV